MASKSLFLGLVAAVALLASPPAPAGAQEIDVSGPLAGAPAVMRMRVYRESRFQVQFHTTMTLQDEFTRALFIGMQLNYHLTDWLGIGVWGGGAAVQLQTSLTDEIAQRGSTNERNTLSLPSNDGFPDQIGKINYIGALQATFIPLRGKLGLFEKLFVDTDFYVFGGVAFVGLQERANVAQGVCGLQQNMIPVDCLRSQSLSASRTAVAPTFGAGLSLYMADFVALTLEWRGLPFSWNTSGTDEAGSAGLFADKQINEDDRLFHFNHMFTLGFAFYLPFQPAISHSEIDED